MSVYFVPDVVMKARNAP